MHNRQTLTIAIPTYNREACLGVLLRNLSAQLRDIPISDVEILISDNCSTDDTPNVAANFRSTHANVRILRNDENRGADYNIAQCFIEARGLFVWILGDDDIVQPGGLAGIVAVLKTAAPDLTYLTAVGVDGNLADLKLPPVTLPLACRMLNRTSFARHVNIHLTFISGMIIRKDSYKQPTNAIFAGLGTSLIQLEWNVNALLVGETFCVVTTPVVYARANQSGGYRLFDVFVTNYLALIHALCQRDKKIARILSKYALWGYLPNLVYAHRFSTVGHFDKQSILPILYKSTNQYAAFWMALGPISVLPKPFAYVFHALAKVQYKLMRLTRRT